MLPYASCRPAAIMTFIGMVCLCWAIPVNGQESGTFPARESASPGDPYLAEESGTEGEKTGAVPPAVSPAPKKAPPSTTEIAPSKPRTTPPAQRAPGQPARQFDTSSMLASRSPLIRLAGLPNMFGDSYGYQLQVSDFAGTGTVDMPLPGGTRGVKISENDKALPMDRVFFIYNHFQNALEANVVGLGVESYPIDQYTLGLEKTFRDGLWSVELRLPFSRTPRVIGTDLDVGTGDVGNLAIIIKRLLYVSESTAVGIGLPIEAPTGCDIAGEGAVSSFSLSNDAVHLAPFVGFLNAPNDRVFCEGFLQVDIPTNGNRVSFGGSDLGELSEQSLLFVDLALGYWLHRNPYARAVTGVAGMVEYHYTTTLENAGTVSGTDGFQFLRFGNPANRMDISNLTIGLHTELGKTTVRVGGVFPLSGGSNRLYDAEVQVSINRQF